ncbi:MAG TPA: carbamoyltransferase HypF [Terriglobia bacterium]|nr:carbamoyltransferase HypF [Terriglobia bacterium]
MIGESARERLKLTISGAVQGVGFRPFVYRLATQLGLNGQVRNSSAGVEVEVEGSRLELNQFLQELESSKPDAAVILQTAMEWLAPVGFSGFEIAVSDEAAAKRAAVLPDLATCPDCLAELFDPADRRYEYAFINCTHCGPRFTIIEDIPYDRPRTSMREFVMCPECEREYRNPTDRRFHAQPNACPHCGPHVWVEGPGDRWGDNLWTSGEAAVVAAAEMLRQGGIVALKGIGGFQLIVDAQNQEAIDRLRARKHRDAKPFALMIPSLEVVRRFCVVSAEEERILKSAPAPIVLLKPNGTPGLAANIASASPYLGVMLPYSPLHYLLMREFPFPVVATSGNLSDEPIAIDNEEARGRLGGIADLMVMHNRPLVRACDDSVVRMVRGRESVMRRARGYAPLPVFIGEELPPVLAVGGHLKNTVAIAAGKQVILSQHIGDLDTVEARRAFERAIKDLCRLYGFKPQVVARDLHPNYASTQWALSSGLPEAAIQHHEAHVAACAAENGVQGPYLGVAWDGTGYGPDGVIWGGEFFCVEGCRFERVAHLRPFRLPGGESAIRQGWRAAASLLWETGGREVALQFRNEPVLFQMLGRGVNSPWTTSVGRLFDALASLAGVADASLFEGQAAMQFERAIDSFTTEDSYLLDTAGGIGDWRPLVETACRDVRNREPIALIAAKFHNALAHWIVAVAEQTSLGQVVLSGGVFQNGYLVGRSVALLEARGFRVYTHHRVPTNDGGIAVGQALLAAWRAKGV